MRAVKRQTIQQCLVAAELLDEANVSRDSMLEGQGGVTHLGMEMAYQVQQLLHTLLKGRRFAARVVSQCQSMRVQPGEVTNYPGICRDLVDTISPFLCVRVSPVVKETLASLWTVCTAWLAHTAQNCIEQPIEAHTFSSIIHVLAVFFSRDRKANSQMLRVVIFIYFSLSASNQPTCTDIVK